MGAGVERKTRTSNKGNAKDAQGDWVKGVQARTENGKDEIQGSFASLRMTRFFAVPYLSKSRFRRTGLEAKESCQWMC
jgi:hypothetical protein